MEMQMNERALSIRRLTEGPKPACRVFLEGVTPEPVILKGLTVSYMLEGIYNKDEAAAFKEVIDDAGRLVASPWLTPGQETLLRAQIPAWVAMSSR